jgi:glycosyltransferase involved in cell wall biosynthesis
MTEAASRLAPLVSVILVVRNGEQFIASALQSVVEQDYVPREVLVVDGHSDDRTVDIALTFPDVRVIPQVGRGIADAYNLGIAHARGEFVSFISHDDMWAPGKLTRQIQYLRENRLVEYVTGRVKFFLEPGCSIPYGFRRELFENDHVGHIMETLVARRTVFDRVGLFDCSLTTAEDVDWFNRARQMGITAAVVSFVVLKKRVHARNSSLRVAENNVNLLRAVRNNIARKRDAPNA